MAMPKSESIIGCKTYFVSLFSVLRPAIAPNYFTVGGPYFSFGHGSYTAMVELFMKNILSNIGKIQKENIKSMTPRQEAADEFVEHANLWLKRTVWSETCSSWFKINGQLTIFPGSRLVLADLLSTPRYEDYLYEYWSKNRFGFLGNGFSTKEFDGSDLAWYLGDKEKPGGLLPAAPPMSDEVPSLTA